MRPKKPKLTINCSTCGKDFLRFQHKLEITTCPKCRNKENFQRYYRKVVQNPVWKMEHARKNSEYAKGPAKRLKNAGFALERLLDRVEKQREKIKKLEEEVKNGK